MSHTRPTFTINADVSEWQYISQGNKSVTYAYTGSDNAYVGKVLKINKDIVRQLRTSTLTYNEALQSIECDVAYHQYVNRLICNDIQHTDKTTVQVCNASTYLVSQLLHNTNVHNQVSADRAHPHIPATLMHNATVCTSDGQPTFCIELKPKWATIQPLDDLPVQMRHPDLAVCRYCMHQHLKLHKGSISSISDFCPIDLFSNDSSRIGKAVTALTTCSQNNLTLFHRNASNDISRIDLQQSLMVPEGVLTGQQLSYSVLMHLLTNSDTQLYHIVARLKSIQQQFASHSLQHLRYVYEQLRSDCNTDVVDLFLSADNDDCVRAFAVEEPASPQHCHADKWPPLSDDSKQQNAHKHDITELVAGLSATELPTRPKPVSAFTKLAAMHALRQHMVATSCRDMSIMIAVQFVNKFGTQTEGLQSVTINGGEHHFVYRVTCVDLDRKSVHKIPYYVQQNTDIVQHFLKVRTLA